MITFIVIIGLIVLILAHEFGHFIVAKIFGVKVEEFGIGFPPRLFGKQIGETLYSVNLLPLGGFVRINGEDEKLEKEEHEKDDTTDSLATKRSFAHQAIWKRTIILIAGVTMNMLVGWIIFSGILMIGSPTHLAVTEVAKDSPAYVVGIKPNDFIMSAKLGAVSLADPIKGDDFIIAMKQVAGEKVSIEVLRDGKTTALEINSRANPPAGEGSLGISLADAGVAKQSFFKALGNGFMVAVTIFWLTLKGFFSLIVSIFTTPGTAFQGVAGPVGLFGIAAQTGKMGLIYLFQLVGLISVNLAVLNLIPFPALDGGRIFFLLIEKLKGSPVSYKIQRVVNAVGFVALILLMVFVTINDVGNIMRK
ncbi:MAG: site-2 protease family protein [Patescibacteria group bacterium]